jgi:hypothetical protein
MTPRKESSDKEEGVLEAVLRSLRAIEADVHGILDKVESCYNEVREGYDERTPEDQYENRNY